MRDGVDETERRDLALIVDVGRSTLRVGITDAAGRLRPESVRSYSPTEQPTVSGAITTFARDHGLRGISMPLAVAVSGLPRGDTISVTNGRWRVSRSGLAAMTRNEPLVLNDFAANAWAISDAAQSRMEPLSGDVVATGAPGTFCIIGIGSGLGVAMLNRNAHGAVTVLPTEAGHCAFPSGLDCVDPLLAALRRGGGAATAESVISGPGLVASYKVLATGQGVHAGTMDPIDLIRLATTGRDPHATAAVHLFVQALWHFAANMVLAHGAFEGVILTGSIAAALRNELRRADLSSSFRLRGPYERQLSTIPRSLVTFAHAELVGAAVALRVERDR